MASPEKVLTGMTLGIVRPSTIERIQTHCNSVAIGKDSNSVGLARGKCVELTKNLSLIQYVRIADEKRGCGFSQAVVN